MRRPATIFSARSTSIRRSRAPGPGSPTPTNTSPGSSRSRRPRAILGCEPLPSARSRSIPISQRRTHRWPPRSTATTGTRRRPRRTTVARSTPTRATHARTASTRSISGTTAASKRRSTRHGTLSSSIPSPRSHGSRKRITLYFARRYDDAIEFLHRLLALEPTWTYGNLFLALAHAQKAEYAAAISALEALLQESPRHPDALAVRGYVHARMGQTEDARADLAELATIRRATSFHRAVVHVGLGEGSANPREDSRSTPVRRHGDPLYTDVSGEEPDVPGVLQRARVPSPERRRHRDAVFLVRSHGTPARGRIADSHAARTRPLNAIATSGDGIVGTAFLSSAYAALRESAFGVQPIVIPDVCSTVR